MCNLCVPYPKGWDSSRTRELLKAIHDAEGHFQIQTKNGLDAARDFDLYSRKDWFGVSLTCDNDEDSLKWEPRASLPSERIEALRFAKDVFENISTWVSFEPVLDPDQTLRLIRTVADFVDFIFIGKLNGLCDPRYPIEVQRLDMNTDWVEFRIEAEELCTSLDIDYQIKGELERLISSKRRLQIA